MPVAKLKRYLDEKNVPYVTIHHSPAYTAQKIAAAAHIKGRHLAKTVMIKVDGKMAMAILDAPHNVDFDRIKQVAGADRVELASEAEFTERFPDCEPGGMPPFGNLYDMDVYVHMDLTQDDHFAFNAGSHTELIQMNYRDFERLVKPKVW